MKQKLKIDMLFKKNASFAAFLRVEIFLFYSFESSSKSCGGIPKRQ